MPKSTPRSVSCKVAAITALLSAVATALPGQCNNQWHALFGGPPDVDGAVYAADEWDPDGPGPMTSRLVVAGVFRFASDVQADKIAAYDPQSRTFSALGSSLPGDFVRDVAADDAGELAAITITGTTATAPGTVFRWDGSNWVDIGAPSNSGLHRAVWANGELYVAGYFATPVNPISERLMRWDGSGWSDVGFGGSGKIEDFVVRPNGNIVAMGTFTAAGGTPANGMAEWNGSLWFPLGGAVPGLAGRRLLLLPNGDVLLGGEIVTGPGTTTVYRWNGLIYSPVVGGSNPGDVLDMALQANGDVVVLSDGFLPTQDRLLTWNGSTWTANGVAPPTDLLTFVPQRAIAMANGELFVAGRQDNYYADERIARFDGSNWSALTSALDGTFTKIETAPSGRTYVISDVSSLGGVPNDGLSYLDDSGWHNVGWPTSGFITDFVECTNGDLVVIGAFSSIGGVAANNIARWDGATWHAMAWSDSNGFTDVVQLRGGMFDGDIVVSGPFGPPTGAPAWRLARWDGTTWHAMGGVQGGNGVFCMLAMPNGELVVGGTFDAAGSVPAANLAKWDGATWSQFGDGWSPTPPSYTWSWAVGVLGMRNGNLVVAGVERAFWPSSSCIAEWTGTGWTAMPLLHDSDRLGQFTMLPNGDVVAAGTFFPNTGMERRIRRWNGTAWTTLGRVRGATWALVATLPNGELLTYGRFFGVDSTPAWNIARLSAGCPPSTTTFGAACIGAVGPIDYAAQTQPWLGTTFLATGSGFAPSTAVVVVNSLQPALAPIPLTTWFPEALPGCDLLLVPDSLGTALTTTGTVQTSLTVPNVPSLAGAVVRQQLVGLEFPPGSTTFAISSSNGLEITLGRY